MEKLAVYRQYVQRLFLDYGGTKPANGDIEVQLIFDTERDHYQLVDLGWDGHRRIYNCVMHLDIKDGKIWIQRNQTDHPITNDLLELGVSKEDIVLGLQPPDMREYTGLGAA